MLSYEAEVGQTPKLHNVLIYTLALNKTYIVPISLNHALLGMLPLRATAYSKAWQSQKYGKVRSTAKSRLAKIFD